MRCLVTNPQPQNDRLAALLRAAGREVLQCPLHVFGPPTDGGVQLHRALAVLQPTDWLSVSSSHGIAALVAAFRATNLSLPRGCRIAAVGAATAQRLRVVGMSVALVAEGGGMALAQAVLQRRQAGEIVTRLLAVQDEAGVTAWHDVLAAAGIAVQLVPAYRKVECPVDVVTWSAQQHAMPIDAVLFTAPSAVHRFYALFGPRLGQSPFTQARYFALGPTTAQAMMERRVPLAGMPTHARLEDLVACVQGEVGNAARLR